jgi:hypothetical protein
MNVYRCNDNATSSDRYRNVLSCLFPPHYIVWKEVREMDQSTPCGGTLVSGVVTV